MERMGPIKIIKNFFGMKKGDANTPPQTLKQFAEEIKELGDAKEEIVELAAKELGVEVNWG